MDVRRWPNWSSGPIGSNNPEIPKLMFELRKTFQIEAAHRLPAVPPGHQCAQLHGHSFVIEVAVEGPLDPVLGWVMDFADMKAALRPLLDRLDHAYLNEIPGLENPTSEHLARWIWEHLHPKLPLLSEIRIAETCTSCCRYRGGGAISPLRTK